MALVPYVLAGVGLWAAAAALTAGLLRGARVPGAARAALTFQLTLTAALAWRLAWAVDRHDESAAGRAAAALLFAAVGLLIMLHWLRRHCASNA